MDQLVTIVREEVKKIRREWSRRKRSAISGIR